MERVSYRQDLDAVKAGGCSVPGCECRTGPVYMRPACHPLSNLFASYLGGVLSLVCAECHTPIVSVAVAEAVTQ